LRTARRAFDNLAVTRETLDKIVAWSMEQALDAGDAYQQFEQYVASNRCRAGCTRSAGASRP
jgi:hypothetical protein